MKLLVLVIFVLHLKGSLALEECFKCAGTAKEDAKECAKDHDFCAGHDRCMLMEYKDPNGKMIYDAMCKHERECFLDAGKIQMCDKKDSCKILKCCKENLCNSASGTWIRFDYRMLVLVFAALITLLWR